MVLTETLQKRIEDIAKPADKLLQPQYLFTYNIASREVAYGILSSQRDGAEHDEDQDEVGENLMVDQLMAEYTNPTVIKIKKREMWRQTGKGSRQKKCNSKSGFVIEI